MLLIKVPLEDTKLRIADIAFVELPPKALPRLSARRGSHLPWRTRESADEDGSQPRQETDRLAVETTGARYTFDPKATRSSPNNGSRTLARSLFGNHRSILSGLEIVRQTETECIVANEHLTFGIQCDSLMMVVPHEELMLDRREPNRRTLESSGVWASAGRRRPGRFRREPGDSSWVRPFGSRASGRTGLERRQAGPAHAWSNRLRQHFGQSDAPEYDESTVEYSLSPESR